MQEWVNRNAEVQITTLSPQTYRSRDAAKRHYTMKMRLRVDHKLKRVVTPREREELRKRLEDVCRQFEERATEQSRHSAANAFRLDDDTIDSQVEFLLKLECAKPSDLTEEISDDLLDALGWTCENYFFERKVAAKPQFNPIEEQILKHFAECFRCSFNSDTPDEDIWRDIEFSETGDGIKVSLSGEYWQKIEIFFYLQEYRGDHTWSEPGYCFYQSKVGYTYRIDYGYPAVGDDEETQIALELIQPDFEELNSKLSSLTPLIGRMGHDNFRALILRKLHHHHPYRS